MVAGELRWQVWKSCSVLL